MLISLSVWVLFLGFQSRKIYPLYKSIATNFNFSHSSNLPIFQSLLGLYCSLWIAVLEFQSHSLPHSPNTQDSNGFQHYFVCFVHDQLKSITSFYMMFGASFFLRTIYLITWMYWTSYSAIAIWLSWKRKFKTRKHWLSGSLPKSNWRESAGRERSETDNIANQLRLFLQLRKINDLRNNRDSKM